MPGIKDVKDAKRANKIEAFKRKQSRKDVRIADRQQRKKEKLAGRQYRMNIRTQDDRGGKHLATGIGGAADIVKSVAENADKIGSAVGSAGAAFV